MSATLTPIIEPLDSELSPIDICHTCTLVSNGYSPDEIGYTPHSEAALVWYVSVAFDEDGDTFDEFTHCDVCDEFAECHEAHGIKLED